MFRTACSEIDSEDGKSSNEARDEECISNGVRFDANVVVVNLANVGRTTLAHKRKHACGEFP